MKEWRCVGLVLLLLCSASCQIPEPNPDPTQSPTEDTSPPSSGSVTPITVDLPYFFPNETEFIQSVSIRIFDATAGSTIFYTIDGTTPSYSSLSLQPGGSFVVSRIGRTIIKAIGVREGLMNSAVAIKDINIQERCSRVVFSPNGGTFAGSVTVKLSSETAGATIHYAVNTALDPRYLEGPTVLSGASIVLGAGVNVLQAIATRAGLAASLVAESRFTVLPKVQPPVISPLTSLFTISATLTISCPTPNVTVYYTEDGSEPSESSLTLDSGSSITVEGTGQHVVKAFATEPSMLRSDVTTKVFTIQERAAAPVLSPPAGRYIGDVKLSFRCSSGGKVYYTLDGVKMPSTASAHVPCNSEILLPAPAVYVVRALSSDVGKSLSVVVQGVFEVVRPFVDQLPIRAASFQVRPVVTTRSFSKQMPAVKSSASTSAYDGSSGPASSVLSGQGSERGSLREGCGLYSVTGRLSVIENPLHHVSLLVPVGGCSHVAPMTSTIQSFARNFSSLASTASTFASPSLSPSLPPSLPPSLSLPQAPPDDGLRAEEVTLQGGHFNSVEELWQSQFEQDSALGCQVAVPAGYFNVSDESCVGSVVSDSHILHRSLRHAVSFGIRNNTFVTGYLSPEDIASPSSSSETEDTETETDSRLAASRFDMLLSGAGWLVRHGESYIAESLSALRDGEETADVLLGRQAADQLSARTVVGHDQSGRLLLLVVDGDDSGFRGMSLTELADLAVELGFYSAVNLIGGQYSGMALNGSLLTQPTETCSIGSSSSSSSSGLLSQSESPVFRCESSVSTVLCVHAARPPAVHSSNIVPNGPPTHTPSSVEQPEASPQPSVPPVSVFPPLIDNSPRPSDDPSLQPTAMPSTAQPTARPSLRSSIPSPQPSHRPNYYFSDDVVDDNHNWPVRFVQPTTAPTAYNATLAASMMIAQLQEAVTVYKMSSGVLGVLLLVSLVAHAFRRTGKKDRSQSEDYSKDTTTTSHGVTRRVPSSSIEMPSRAVPIPVPDDDGMKQAFTLRSSGAQSQPSSAGRSVGGGGGGGGRGGGKGGGWQSQLSQLSFNHYSDEEEDGDLQSIELYSHHPQQSNAQATTSSRGNRGSKKGSDPPPPPPPASSSRRGHRSKLGGIISAVSGGGRGGGGGGGGKSAEYAAVPRSEDDDDVDDDASGSLNPFHANSTH